MKKSGKHIKKWEFNYEKNLFAFFQASPDILIILDNDYNILDLNNTAIAALQYKAEELLGKPLADLCSSENIEELKKSSDEILAGSRVSCPLKLQRESGELLSAEAVFAKVVLDGTECLIAFCRDKSEQLMAEEAASKKEEQYKILFNNLSDAAFVHEFTNDNLPGKFIEVNDIACRRLGYTREELLEMTPRDIDAPEGWALVPEMMEKLKANKHAVWEGIHVTKDRRKIPVEINNHLFEMGGKQVILSTVRDITQSKASEEMLRRSEEKYRKIFENVQDTFYQADTNGIITEISPSIEKYSGYRPDELIGMKIESVYRDPEERDALLKILSEKGEVEDYIVHLYNKKGRLVYASANVHLLFAPDGKAVGIEGALRDVTERFLAEERLRESEKLLRKQNEEYVLLNEELNIAREKAVESDRLKSAFLANMSHEIRTPMNGIVGFSQMLGDPGLPKEDREAYIRIVNSSCEQLLHIINDIIDISKIEAGQIDLSESQFSLRELLDEVYSFFMPSATAASLRLILDPVQEIIAEMIVSDRTKIRQVLDNLVNNAIKYTAFGEVSIKCWLSDEMLKFEVKDTGIGILPEMHDAIFKRFTQLDAPYIKNKSGTGLGLSISKAYVEKMGGSIGFTSVPGMGSTFWFTLPYKPFFGKNKSEATDGKGIKTKKSLTVLIIEDEEINWLYLSEILKKHAKIIHAANGEVALDHIKNNHEIDLVLMDIKLPDIDGFELTRMIKSINSNIPVIAQTAYALSGDREKALKAGCDEYLAKPVNRDDLLNMISVFSGQGK